MQSDRLILTPGDPFRDALTVWDIAGLPADGYTLVSAAGKSSPLTASSPSVGVWADPWARRLQVPADAKPGDYRLTHADVPPLVVTVLPSPKVQQSARFTPSTGTALQVQKALDAGKPVSFGGGGYVFDRPVNLPPGAVLEGFGAHLFGTPNTLDYGPLFTGGQDATLRGLALHPWQSVFANRQNVTGLVVDECAVVGGDLGVSLDRCLFRDVTFERATVLQAAGGLFLRCRWVGNLGGHAFCRPWGIVGGLALIDCEFDGTDRGPVFQTNVGPITDTLVVGLTLRRIIRDYNGNEGVLTEGGGSYDRNLIVHLRVAGCDGYAVEIGSPARGNRVYDLVQEGGGGYWLTGGDDVPQTDNGLANFELRGGGITFGWQDNTGRVHGASTTSNFVRDGALVGWKSTRLNQGRYDPVFYARDAAVLGLHPTAGLTNTVTADFVDLPAGVVPCRGVTGVNCRVVRGESAVAVSQ